MFLGEEKFSFIVLVFQVITFDKYGVSNHPNHISIFYAVAYLCLEKQLPKSKCWLFKFGSRKPIIN